MALLTTRAKLAVMHILRLVTRQALAANGRSVFALGRCLLMAAFATHFAMCAI
jgi:hypothetical protein